MEAKDCCFLSAKSSISSRNLANMATFGDAWPDEFWVCNPVTFEINILVNRKKTTLNFDKSYFRFSFFFVLLSRNCTTSIHFQEGAPRLHIWMQKLEQLLRGHLLSVSLVSADNLNRSLIDLHHELVLLVPGRGQASGDICITEPIISLQASQQNCIRRRLTGFVAKLCHPRILYANLIKKLKILSINVKSMVPSNSRTYWKIYGFFDNVAIFQVQVVFEFRNQNLQGEASSFRFGLFFGAPHAPSVLYAINLNDSTAIKWVWKVAHRWFLDKRTDLYGVADESISWYL